MTQVYRFECADCGTTELFPTSGDPRELDVPCGSCGDLMSFDGRV